MILGFQEKLSVAPFLMKRIGLSVTGGKYDFLW